MRAKGHPAAFPAAVLVGALMLAGCATSAPSTAVPGTAPAAIATQGGAEMKVTSSGYADMGTMPARFATKQVAGGGNVSVPLEWSGAPEGTKSFVVVMVDTHPVAGGWVHWLVTGVPAAVTSLPEGGSGASMPAGAVEHATSWGATGYGGPQPPPGTGVHDYVTTVYALDTADIGLPADAEWSKVGEAIAAHTLTSASVTGRFGR